MAEQVERKDEKHVRLIALSIASATVIAASGVCGYAVYVIARNPEFWTTFVFAHFSAIMGIPAAAGAAFALVMFLRQTDGPIEFEGLGFKFKGAAGQLVMWLICFLAFAGALKLLW